MNRRFQSRKFTTHVSTAVIFQNPLVKLCFAESPGLRVTAPVTLSINLHTTMMRTETFNVNMSLWHDKCNVNECVCNVNVYVMYVM